MISPPEHFEHFFPFDFSFLPVLLFSEPVGMLEEETEGERERGMEGGERWVGEEHNFKSFRPYSSIFTNHVLPCASGYVQK